MDEVENTEVDGAAAQVVLQDELTITLRKPVSIGKSGEPYTKLDLREPTAGELEKAMKATNDVGVVVNLISLVAKVPRAVAEGLCQRDFKDASNFFGSLSEDAPATGATSSQS